MDAERQVRLGRDAHARESRVHELALEVALREEPHLERRARPAVEHEVGEGLHFAVERAVGERPSAVALLERPLEEIGEVLLGVSVRHERHREDELAARLQHAPRVDERA